VAPGVIDTDAHQTTHSLLLTRSAESDARPWLEILADDVRCTHGATVGRLDDTALFYLRSRGISEATARSMLIDAFAREITDSVEIESLREHLSACIAARQGLGGGDE
jgi:Fe-S cluster assembly protein SufD